MLITTEIIDIIKRERVSSAANTSASRSPTLSFSVLSYREILLLNRTLGVY